MSKLSTLRNILSDMDFLPLTKKKLKTLSFIKIFQRSQDAGKGYQSRDKAGKIDEAEKNYRPWRGTS